MHRDELISRLEVRSRQQDPCQTRGGALRTDSFGITIAELGIHIASSCGCRQGIENGRGGNGTWSAMLPLHENRDSEGAKSDKHASSRIGRGQSERSQSVAALAIRLLRALGLRSLPRG